MLENYPLRDEAERWALLAEAGQRLAEATDCEDALQAAAALAIPRLGDWAIVDFAETDGSVRRLIVADADAEKQALARRLAAEWPPATDEALGVPAVLRTRAPRVVAPVTNGFLSDVARDGDHLGTLPRLGIASHITVPFLGREHVSGAMTFVRSSPGSAHTPADLALAEDLAARCALAISRMRQLEDLEKSVHLRDQVLAYVAHDLKNPLGAIVFAASHILDDARAPRENTTPEHRIRVAESILTATVHMQRLIGDLLEVAQIGAGGVSIERQRLDPSALVEDVRYTYDAGLAARSLRLVTALPERLPVLLADPSRLRQVFENLLENAAKFTADGGVITLGAAHLDGSVLFSVADTGRGIPQEDMPRLFDRFWQSRRQGTGSAGLGLTICRGIVEAHGGQIWAESQVGSGSTFFFRIPASESATRPDVGGRSQAPEVS